MTMTMTKTLLLALTVSSVAAFAPPTTSHHAVASQTSLAMSNSPFDAFKNIFSANNNNPVVAEEEPPALPDVVIDPDYKLGAIFLVAGLLLDTIPYVQLLPGPFVTLLGVLFLVQANRVRFLFDKDSFELKIGEESSGENVVVGGENKWSYDSFVNWEFFPENWIDQPQGPVLVYFKETQTPSDKWNEGPGQSANSEEALSSGAVPGQVHFFPVICDAQQLKDEFEKRGCAKL